MKTFAERVADAPDAATATRWLSLARKERARRSLLEFAKYVWPSFEVSWHHVVLARHLDRVIAGDCRRLMINMPPRHGKSLLTSVLMPALYLARNPDKRVIACSYSAELANELARELYRVIDSDGFRDLFPDWHIGETRQANSFTIAGHRGAYLCAGVGGGIVGRGFNLGIIDDPIKGRAEASSETVRANTDDWLRNDFESRTDAADACEVLMHQRWHDDDPAARILRRMREPGATNWEVLELPAVAREDRHPDDHRRPGEALWPNRYPRPFLDAKRIDVGPYTWASVWQQRPTPEGGGIFKREWLRYWRTVNGQIDVDGARRPLGTGRRFATVDLAVMKATASDYTVIACWEYQADGRLYLLDVLRARLDGPDIVKAMHQARARWHLGEIFVEEVAWQIFLMQQAIVEGLPIRSIKPLGKKAERAFSATPWFEQGRVMLPSDAAWLADFEHELLSFTADESHRHDDQVDCAAYACQIAFAGGGALPAGNRIQRIGADGRDALWGMT